MKNRIVSPTTSRSLTTILAISFLGLSALVLFLSTLIQLVLTVQTQQRNLDERQLLIAQSAGISVSDFIEHKYNDLEIAADLSNPIAASLADRATILEGLLGLDPALRQIVLLDRQGKQLGFVSRVSQTLSPQFEDRLTDEGLSATAEGNRYLSDVYLDDDTIEPMIVLAIPIETVLGDYQGTLITEINLKFIWDLVSELRVGNTGYVYVVDQRGDLLAYKDTSLVLQGVNAGNMGNLGEFLNDPSATGANRSGIQQYTGLNGSTVIGTFVPLGTPPWAVVIELPFREAYQEVIALGVRSLALFFVIAILAGLFGYFGARRASAPLIDLSRVATEIASGNLHAQATETGAAELVQLAGSFNNMTAQLRDSITNLEQRVAERTADLSTARNESERRAKDLQTISEISRIISSEQRPDILLPLITRLVSEKFDFYHTGIFLIESTRQYAALQASNSEGGQRMLNRGHRLELGKGIVGTVAQIGTARVALDVGADAVFFDNPDLPTTRSEMALPLNVRGETIGVLDVQSTRPGEFTESNLNTLSILGDQIAIAIENARLFARTQQALTEAQTLYSQYLQKEWKAFRSKSTNVGYQQSPTGGKPLEVPVETDEIQKALRRGEIILAGSDNGSQTEPTMIVPIKLRGETIGVLNIKAPAKDRKWSRDEINMIESVSERLALALENARLFEETNRRAERERLVSEITGKIRSVNDPQVMIQTALEELRNVLGASRVQVIPQLPAGSTIENKTNTEEV